MDQSEFLDGVDVGNGTLPVKASSGRTRRSMTCKEVEDEERMASAWAMFSFTCPSLGEN